MHRATVVVVNNQRLVFGGGFKFVIGLQLPALGAILQRALRAAHVGITNGLANRVQ
ncbi:hypothetical protein D3C75_1279040 [compost metagenome]